MKRYARVTSAVVLGAICLLMGPRKAATQVKDVAQEEPKHYSWLVERLKEVDSVRVGMTRADLLKVFEPDGGLSRVLPERYVLRSCTLIKVNVQFEFPKGTPVTTLPLEFEFPKGTSKTNLPNDSELKISAISKPYLEPMFMD